MSEIHPYRSNIFGLYGNVLQWPPPMAATHRRVTKHGSGYLRVVVAIGGGHCNQDRQHHGWGWPGGVSIDR